MRDKAQLPKASWLFGGFLVAGLILVTAVPAAASEGVPSPAPYKMMWAAINFFILLAILYKFAYNPILQMLDDRRNTIESSLRHAEEVRSDVERMMNEAEAQLMNARKEAQEIVARAGKLGEETREEILAKAKEEASAERARAIADIQNEKDKALAELRDTAANLAILAAEKVLGKAITVDDHQKMVKEFVDEVGDRLC